MTDQRLSVEYLSLADVKHYENDPPKNDAHSAEVMENRKTELRKEILQRHLISEQEHKPPALLKAALLELLQGEIDKIDAELHAARKRLVSRIYSQARPFAWPNERNLPPVVLPFFPLVVLGLGFRFLFRVIC